MRPAARLLLPLDALPATRSPLIRPRPGAGPDARLLSLLRRALPLWYRRARRALPWRESQDPYAIWISEVMLQQTRVEAVLPYWRRFLERFPSVRDLACASDAEVLALWSGLGYYGRARKLHDAARAIVLRHDGRFPPELEDALALPGVGRYTAGAVLSIAYDLAHPVVDGNVARVLCRLFALEGDPTGSRLQRELWSLAEELLPARGAGEWNQALMELGATVCLPRSPRCVECPLEGLCAARAAGRAEELPQARVRRAPLEVEIEMLLVRSGERVLLARRPRSGRMAGMLELPTREKADSTGAGCGLFASAWPAGLEAGEELARLAHSITHHRIRAALRAGRLSGSGDSAELCWRSAGELAQLELTGLARKALRAVLRGGSAGAEGAAS